MKLQQSVSLMFLRLQKLHIIFSRPSIEITRRRDLSAASMNNNTANNSVNAHVNT